MPFSINPVTGQFQFYPPPPAPSPGGAGGIDPAAVAITGGTMSGVTITGSPISGSTGAFTGLSASSSWLGATTISGYAAQGLAVSHSGSLAACAWMDEISAWGITANGFSNGDSMLTVRTGGSGVTLQSRTTYSVAPAIQALVIEADGVLIRRSTADQTLSIGAASGTGGGVLVLHQSASAPTPTAEDAMFYSLAGGEGYGMDGSGNQTLLTPHATDAPEWLYEVGPGGDHLERKVNVYLATVKFWNVDRERHLHAQHLVSVGFGPTGTQEESLAAWNEVAQRRVSGRLLCEHEETFEEYKTRTGKSLVPANQDEEWWMSHNGVERWRKVESDREEVSLATVNALQSKKDAVAAAHAEWEAAMVAFTPTPEIPNFVLPEPVFSEIIPPIYKAAQPPSFLFD